MNQIGLLAVALGAMIPQHEMERHHKAIKQGGSSDPRDLHPVPRRVGGVDFGKVEKSYFQSCIRLEVVPEKNARPKGRGQRCREAALRKGMK